MLTAEGHSGNLRVAGRLAARLGRWSLSSESGAFSTVTAEVLFVDAYYAAMSPLRLILHLGNRAWSWREAQFVGTVISVVGPPQEHA